MLISRVLCEATYYADVTIYLGATSVNLTSFQCLAPELRYHVYKG